MAFVVRTKDNPGDVGRAADQQQSVDNEVALYAAVLGEGPLATGGMVRQFVKKTGIADVTATAFATITTANEAGDTDGGVYMVKGDLLVAHGIGPTGQTSAGMVRFVCLRSLGESGAAGLSWITESNKGGTSYSVAATKNMADTVAITAVETSEYVVELRVYIDLTGTTITTGFICGMLELTYAGFSTPPVITSAG